MGKKDMDRNSVSGIFYNFRSHINEEFSRVVKRQPLQDILLGGGAMKLHPEFYHISKNPVYFEKEIVGSPEEYSDLCIVSPTLEDSSGRAYIRVNDLYSLLLSKGFNEESISIIFGEYGTNKRNGIYLRYDDVVNLGARYQRSIPHMLKKDIIKDD